MTSDRFGEIRIKPAAGEGSQDYRDDEIEKKKKEEAPPENRRQKTESPAGDIRNRTGGEFPFSPAVILSWIAVPLFLVLLYGVGSYFLVPSLVKGPLAKNFSESLSRPVTVKRVIFSPFSRQVFLKNVSVGTAYGDPDKQNLLECAEFSCRIDASELFNRKLVCHEVKIKGVALNLIRLPLGAFSVADAANFFSLVKGRTGKILWPEWLVLDGVLLTDGKIVVNDSLTRQQHRIEQIRLYLPSAGESLAGDDALPSLNAVFNASPVQIDGRRQRNRQGVMETRFTLRFSEIVLKNYLEHMPVISQNPFHLAEGQADINVDLVIPELSSEENRLNIRLDARIRALQFADKNGRAILKVPEAGLNIRAVPSRNRYIIQQAEFIDPELTINLDKKQAENQHGVTFPEVTNFLQGLEQYPHGIRIEKFSCSEGKVYIFTGEQKNPQYRWEKGELHLNGLQNPAADLNDQAAPPPAAIRISATEQGGGDGTRLQIDGTVREPLKLDGTLSVSNVDLKKHAVHLSRGMLFTGGRADVEGDFTYNFGADAGKAGGHRAKLDNGSLTVKEYSLQREGSPVLSGGHLACRKTQVDFAAQEIWCDEISLSNSRIDGDLIGPASLAQKIPGDGQWAVRGRKLTVTGSRLQKRLANPLVQDKDVAFTLENFSLQADNLQSADPEKGILRASGRIGAKGNLSLNGAYSPVSGKGRLQVRLDDLELQVLQKYISPWFKPAITGGRIDAEGMYRVEDREFTGRVGVRNLLSGNETEPSLQWQEAATESLYLKMAPFTLECAEINVVSPSASFGISHAEKPVSLFLQPLQNTNDSVTIHKIRFTGGILQMPEPVILQGYQPRLSGLSGTISPVGQEPMYFHVGGGMAEQGSFTINGTAGMKSIDEYTLEVSGVPLAPFRSFFAGSIGLDVSGGTGSWRQIMRQSDGEYTVESRIRLHDVAPESGSSYFKTIALYTDENNSIESAEDQVFRQREDRLFLFDLFVRRMKHDAVKTDLSEQLILKKLLPELSLQGRVQFVSGTSTLVLTRDLTDYEQLLGRRPYLGLQLVGQYDPQLDAEALKHSLQQEEDAKREAENSRRAEERRKLIEQEKKRLAEMQNDPKQVMEEEISPVELTRDLQPLPFREVKVKPDMLHELARARADALHDFFVNGLLISPDRVRKSVDTGQSGPEVHVRLQPYYPETAEKKKAGENDPAVN